MKALFIRCYGVLTPDMLVGGLIDMGVPPAYLKARLEQAGAPAVFIEKANDKAQLGAHYFHIPGGEGPVSAASLREEWDALCSRSGASFAAAGQRVLALLGSGADLAPLRVRQADARSLFCFLAGVEYLDAEAVYTCPFELGHGTDEGGALTEQILVRAGSTAGLPIPADGITPFAAAMLEGSPGLYAHRRPVPAGPDLLRQRQQRIARRRQYGGALSGLFHRAAGFPLQPADEGLRRAAGAFE